MTSRLISLFLADLSESANEKAANSHESSCDRNSLVVALLRSSRIEQSWLVLNEAGKACEFQSTSCHHMIARRVLVESVTFSELTNHKDAFYSPTRKYRLEEFSADDSHTRNVQKLGNTNSSSKIRRTCSRTNRSTLPTFFRTCLPLS